MGLTFVRDSSLRFATFRMTDEDCKILATAVFSPENEKSKSSREIADQVASGTLDTTSLKKQQQLEPGVFVFSGGKSLWKPVKTGIASERFMEILDGIAEGDSVINGPYRVLARDLKNDDAVELKKEEDKNKKAEEDNE